MIIKEAPVKVIKVIGGYELQEVWVEAVYLNRSNGINRPGWVDCADIMYKVGGIPGVYSHVESAMEVINDNLQQGGHD